MTPQPAITQSSPGPTQTPPISPARMIESASQTLANQLVSNLPADKKLRIGIVPFSDKSGQAGTLAQALQESLRNQLFLTKRFDVVEDTDMQKVLRELRIQEQGQGVLSQETIQRMGELLAAEAIVVGTITDLISDYGVNCRLVPIKSGVIASVATATVPKTALSDGSGKKSTETATAKDKTLEIDKNSQRIGNLLIKVESFRLLPGDNIYGFARLTLILANTSESQTLGVALEDNVYDKMIVSNSRGDEFRAIKGDVSGIDTAFGEGDRFFGNVTDIPPKGSLRVVAKSQVQWTGRAGEYRPYRLQASVIVGIESQGRYPGIRNHNVVIDIE